MSRTILILTIVGCLAALTDSARANVERHPLFGDNMVLQQGVAAPVWGKAEPGERVTVTLGDQTATAVSDEKGKWLVKLGPLKADGTPREMTIAGKNTITLTNVVVGEVWLGSGQSNMALAVKEADNSEKEIAAANHPLIRFFAVETGPATEPQTGLNGHWVVCAPETVADFSAAAYFFGRELHKALNVPVGLIRSAVGGTPIEAWCGRGALEAQPDGAVMLKQWDELRPFWPAPKNRKKEVMNQWMAALAKARPGDPSATRLVHGWMTDPSHQPSVLFNGMIAPLVPFALRGVIWYQGECNARWSPHPEQYGKSLCAMIQDWRRLWDNPDLSFLTVQLHNMDSRGGDANRDCRLALVREGQLQSLSLPKTGLAVAIDIGGLVHPKNKQEAGRRLALAAQEVSYGKPVVGMGPIFQSATVEGDQIRLKFTHVGGGLMTRDNASLDAFAIAGENKHFEWAEAKLDGDTVLVSAKKIPKPVAVRYGWSNNPRCNLDNREGLPAAPFRTDDWPPLSQKPSTQPGKQDEESQEKP